MMMETVVYSREYLFVKELYDKGELGRLQFLRGSHQQDMDGWPDYWPGLPPMWYATHCVSPCLAILGKHAKSVVCHGSGRIREELIGRYGSPFAVETATFTIKDSDVVAEVTRSLFDVARQYRESFDATGSKKSFEWQQVEGEDPVIHTKSTPEQPLSEPEIAKRVKVPDYAQSAARAHPPIHPAGGDSGCRAPFVPSGRRPRRLASAPGPRVSERAQRRPPCPARRRDLGQLDHGRPLRPRVGDERRKTRRHPRCLSGRRSSRSSARAPALAAALPVILCPPIQFVRANRQTVVILQKQILMQIPVLIVIARRVQNATWYTTIETGKAQEHDQKHLVIPIEPRPAIRSHAPSAPSPIKR